MTALSPTLRAENIAAWKAATAERHAERDAMRDIVARLPDPADYAYTLPLDVVGAMKAAYRSGSCLRVADGAVAQCRSLGLVEFGGPFLTVFGMQVRKAIVRGDV